MMIFPLTIDEEKTVRWLLRLVPAVAAAVILALGAMSAAASM
ncbi:MAG: hypothetical protein FLDDKLPJ_03430 [Phycisphaerae bacterium]|nr:hypothetical protein [Phycisphaerae bacterium]